MKNSIVDEPQPRNRTFGWTSVIAGGNGHELLSRSIRARGLYDAAVLCGEVVAIVVRYHQEDFTQVHVRSWQVEVVTSTYVGKWRSKEHMQMAIEIGEVSSN